MEEKVHEMPYHITITDNRTAEILVDIDADVIIGGFSSGEDGHRLCFAEAAAKKVIGAAAMAESTTLEVEKEIPHGRRLRKKIVRALTKGKIKERRLI